MVEAYWTTTYNDVDQGKVRALLGPHMQRNNQEVYTRGATRGL
jgi:hypothetical protein